MGSILVTAALGSAVVFGTFVGAILSEEPPPLPSCMGTSCLPAIPGNADTHLRSDSSSGSKSLYAQAEKPAPPLAAPVPTKKSALLAPPKEKLTAGIVVIGKPERLSCGDGRAVVAKRYERVRVLECTGSSYTYLGQKKGASFKIRVNARDGRITGRTAI